MKSFIVPLLCSSLVAAHSAVTSVIFDGVRYPARSGPIDNAVAARRAEWKSASGNYVSTLFTYMPLSNVSDPGITCQSNASPPELKAYARAGSDVSVTWSPIVRGHLGPVMSYLGRWEPNQKPQDVKFFKISQKGYDSQLGLWGNEELVLANNTDVMKIPSDIKPGLYIFRTELLALHGNSPFMLMGPLGGPQFYPHCFNVEISGTGTVEPEGVTIPGAYHQNDMGVMLDVWSTKKDEHKKYIVPGPQVYQGKYDAPVGSPVEVKETGTFPPEFEKRFVWLTDTLNELASGIVTLVNTVDAGSARGMPSFSEVIAKASSFMNSTGKVSKFLSELEAFKNDYTKSVSTVAKRFVA